MSLERVKQTSRTILVEEFNPEYEDLSTLLATENVLRKSEFLSKVESSLEVRTFEEFVERFAPKVYESTVVSNDPEMPMTFQYSLEKKEGANEVEISKHAFYRMVMDIYEDRAESGLSNTKTDTFKRISELLSPMAVLDQAKKIRKQLQYVEKKLGELKDTPGIEQEQYKRKKKEIRKDIIKTYAKSAIGLIPLALADTQEKLKGIGFNETEGKGKSSGASQYRPCKYHFDNNGDLVVEKLEDREGYAIDSKSDRRNGAIEMSSESCAEVGIVSTSGESSGASSDEQLEALKDRLKKDFNQHSNEDGRSEFFGNLVVEVYTASSLTDKKTNGIIMENVEKLEKKKNLYMSIYKNAQEEFIKTISDTVEKMLGVKTFFDHASRRGRLQMAPLIVTNCKASDLLESDVKKSFELYIGEMGQENSKNSIWFAIIPGIGDSDFVEMESPIVEDEDDDISEEELNSTDLKEVYGKKLVTLESCKALIEIFRTGRITSFFNFKANDKTGFDSLTGEIVEKYKDKLESLNGNKYAVFAYPNFTLLPLKETCIEIGTTIRNGKETKERLDLPGIYVEASYVAAGMVVGSQDPFILKEKGFKVDLNNACVRFDFEEGNNNKIFLTRMAREEDSNWNLGVGELVRRDMFGFCFCGNEMYFENKLVKNSYVYTARTMNKSENGGNYKALYKTLTEKFIIQYLAVENGGEKAKESTVKSFVSKAVSKWKNDCEGNETKKYANNILRSGEEVRFSEEDRKIHITFREDDELVDLEVVGDN